MNPFFKILFPNLENVSKLTCLPCKFSLTADFKKNQTYDLSTILKFC